MPTITLDAAATLLNQHTAVFANEIKSTFRQGLEFESFLPVVSGDEYYAAGNATPGDVLQPYQAAFTPNSTVDHAETALRIRPIKLDLEFTEADLEKFYASYYQQWFEAGKDPNVWTYPRYIYEMILMPKILEELNDIAWNGVYAAPTPGTPGAYIDSCDGYKTLIASLASANKIGEAASGSFTASDIVDKLEAWLDLIPSTHTSRGGTILMSKTNMRKYLRDYRSSYYQTQMLAPDNGVPEISIDGYNAKLKGLAAMEGSNRWIFLPNNDRNMIVVTRQGYPMYPQLVFDTEPRKLQMYATIYRAFGFEYAPNVYINDQA